MIIKDLVGKKLLRINQDHIPDLGWKLANSGSANFSVTSDIQIHAKSQMHTSCANTITSRPKMAIAISQYNIRKRKPTKRNIIHSIVIFVKHIS